MLDVSYFVLEAGTVTLGAILAVSWSNTLEVFTLVSCFPPDSGQFTGQCLLAWFANFLDSDGLWHILERSMWRLRMQEQGRITGSTARASVTSAVDESRKQQRLCFLPDLNQTSEIKVLSCQSSEFLSRRCRLRPVFTCPSLCILCANFLLYNNPSPVGLRFYPNHLYRNPVCGGNHTLRSQGLGLQYRSLLVSRLTS